VKNADTARQPLRPMLRVDELRSVTSRYDRPKRAALHVCVAARCAALLLALSPATSAHAQGIVLGRVTDPMQTPIRDAEVRIDKIDILTRTDTVGRFSLRGVPSGPQRITVRRLGYAPKSVEVRVAAGDSLAIQVVLVPRAQVLPVVPVEGAGIPPVPRRLRDFERRRTSGVGHFLTAADLTPERSKLLGDVLVRLPGTYVVQSSAAACLTSRRGSQSLRHSATGWCGSRSIDGNYCAVAVFLDGFPAYSGHSEEVFNLNTLRADEVAGVEFYSGSATIPREFSAPRGTCGVLVIWTKE